MQKSTANGERRRAHGSEISTGLRESDEFRVSNNPLKEDNVDDLDWYSSNDAVLLEQARRREGDGRIGGGRKVSFEVEARNPLDVDSS